MSNHLPAKPPSEVAEEVKVPNAETRRAIADAEVGKVKRFTSVADLMADLDADDETDHIEGKS